MFKEERRKVLKSQRIDESIKININLQQPPTTTSESSISQDIKKLRKIVENQNLQIQLLQEKTDSLETKDSEKEVQIQSKNDEIILLKQTIQSQQENHVFFFNSNAKIWLTLNNLEKQISSNSKYSESNESKEITFLDIKKYLQKNPKEAADVERIAKDVKYSLEKNLSVLNESNSKSENLLRKRNHKRQRRMGEKSYKQKNVDDFVKSTTIDEKLETFGIRRSLSPKNIRNSFIDIEVTVMPDQFDDNADWSSLEKNESEKEKEKHVSHRHSRLSPTNSIINVLTTSPFAYNGDDADSIISSIVSDAPTIDYRRSFTDVTQQLDQFDDNYSDSDDENVILERRRKNRLSAVLENPNITSSCSKQYRDKIQNSFSDATVMPDKFDDEWSSSEKNESKNLHDQSVNEKQNSFSEVTVMPDQFDDNADWSSLEKNESEEEKQKHVSHHHCRSSPTNSIINVLTTSPFADNGDDAFNESLVSQVSIARTFDNCRRSFSDVTQQLDQFDDNYSDSDDDESVILLRRRKNRLSTVLENPNITSSCSKQYREKIQNSFSEVTLVPDQFDDDSSSTEENDSKNLDQSLNENDFYMEIPNNFHLWSKNQNKPMKEKESKISKTEMKTFPDKFGRVLYDSDSDVNVSTMKDQFDDYM